MLLAVDVGNTSISFGIFNQEILIKKFTLASDKKRSVDEYGILISSIIEKDEMIKNKIKSAVLGSVVTNLTDVLIDAIKKYLNVEVVKVTTKIETGVKYCLDNSKELGADRIANAVEAGNLAKGKNCVVVDFGTATNFDVISKNVEFLGGVIAPGINISAMALNNYTSLLPKIRVEKPAATIGKNTVDCILSGIIIGHAKMIDGILENIENELGEEILVIGTGGYCDIVKSLMRRTFDVVEPNLTLNGLKLIWEKNSKKKF